MDDQGQLLHIISLSSIEKLSFIQVTNNVEIYLMLPEALLPKQQFNEKIERFKWNIFITSIETFGLIIQDNNGS